MSDPIIEETQNQEPLDALDVATSVNLSEDSPITDTTGQTEEIDTQAAEATEKPVSDDSAFMFIPEIGEYYGQSKTVTQEFPILLEPSKKKPFNEFAETMQLPALPTSIMVKYSENFPNLDVEKDADSKDWVEGYRASTFYSTSNDQFVSRLKKKGSQFHQSVNYEGKNLAAGAVNLSSNPGDKLTGEKAVYWVKTVTGQGGIIQIPLWHSGFWVSIKTPSEIALLELNARIAEDKIEFGRQSYGLAFSNSTVFFTSHIVNFILDHVFDHSIKEVKDIRDLIVSQDIYLLAWGMACAIWKNGFQYTRSIVNEDNTAGKVIKALLAVPRLCFTDRSALTDWQKSHMAGRHGKHMTLESIEKYRKEFTVGHTRSIVVDEENDTQMELAVPYLDQYLNSGQKWVNFLVSKVDAAMQMASDDGRRNTYITQYGKASLLRQYAHWVKSITVKGRTFEDTDTVELLLDDMSANQTVREIYFKEIGKFIDDTTVSLIAVPAVKGVDSLDKNPRFPYLVPIDPLMTFFTLLVQKVELVKAR